ncbi:CENP-Q, a CENPA-CAD centromere complex subunit-domain-containing protein [Daldinia sp. FL1419]|nr:CENP-Q, a CENPA-CAD centromere complex subunit-domain-containing protein [Daldinia sp. FL1419]
MEEASRPRKRGRPANSEIPSQAQPESQPSQTQRAKRKRGILPTAQPNDDGGERGEDQGALHTERKKRGRPQVLPTNNEAELREGSTSNTKDGDAPRNKRGRPPKDLETTKDNVVEEDEADDENEGNSSLLRRSGRIRRSPESTNKGARKEIKTNKQKSGDQISNKRQKKGRAVDERTTAEVEQGSALPKKRGRPSLNNQPLIHIEAEPNTQNQPKKRGRQPPPDVGASSSMKGKGKKPQIQAAQDKDVSAEEENRSRKKKPRQSNKTSSKAARHRQSPDAQHRSSSPDSAASPPRYRHLATRTRRVPFNIIESKWTALEQPALSSVASLLQSASRPVLLRLTNPQRHGHAAAALNAVSKRLCSKIARGLPFPPATTTTRREEEFEFERTVSGIQALESQLDPLLHSVELLRREKERAEKELDREYKALTRLGSNAHAEARERRDQIRKMHVLVPETVPPESKTGSVGEVVSVENSTGEVFTDLDDELASLANQIANHMESMRGNLQQIDGIVPAIAKNQGLLRATLQSRLDREQLDNIILG